NLLRLERRRAEDVALPHRRVLCRARGHAEQPVHTGKERGPIVAEAIECASLDQAFQHALADDPGIDARAEILQAFEGLLVALLDDVLHRRLAHALDGRERIIDAVLTHFEVTTARCDRWRDYLDAEPEGLAAEIVELFGVGHVVAHGRGQELDRMMRL